MRQQGTRGRRHSGKKLSVVLYAVGRLVLSFPPLPFPYLPFFSLPFPSRPSGAISVWIDQPISTHGFSSRTCLSTDSGFLLCSLGVFFFVLFFRFFSFCSEFRRWRDFRRKQGPKGRATTIVMASVGKCRTLFARVTIRFVLSNLFSKVYTLVFDHLRLPRVIPKKTKIAVFRFISLW